MLSTSDYQEQTNAEDVTVQQKITKIEKVKEVEEHVKLFEIEIISYQEDQKQIARLISSVKSGVAQACSLRRCPSADHA